MFPRLHYSVATALILVLFCHPAYSQLGTTPRPDEAKPSPLDSLFQRPSPVVPTTPIWQVDPYGQVRFAPSSMAAYNTGLFSIQPPMPGDPQTLPTLPHLPHSPADLLHPHGIPRLRFTLYKW